MKRHFVITLVAEFVAIYRYMQRHYLPAKAVKKHYRLLTPANSTPSRRRALAAGIY